jgi:phosphate transport system protein
VPDELRTAYHRQLGEIETELARMIVLVEESISGAATALLSADRRDVERVVANVDAIERRHRTVETLIFSQLVRQSPVARELRFLVAALRIIPEIELTANLAANLAQRGGGRVGTQLPPRVRGLVAELFDRGLGMWREVAEILAEHDPLGARRLEAEAAKNVELHAALGEELASGALPPSVLIDMALVARFLERIGDHAVEVARWIESFSAPSSRREA